MSFDLKKMKSKDIFLSLEKKIFFSRDNFRYSKLR